MFRSVTNDKAKHLANYLEEHGIPVYSPRSKMFFDREEIKACIGIILHLFSDFEEELLEDDSPWFEDMVNYYNECLEVAYELMDEDSALEEWVSYRMKELADLKGNTDYAFTRLLYHMFTVGYFKEIIDTDLASGVADQRAIRNLAIMPYDRNMNFDEFCFRDVKKSELKQSYAFTTDIAKYERCSLEYKMFRELGFSEIRVGSTLFGSFF